MNNPGVYNLGSRVITGAMSGEVITLIGSDEFVDGLEGILSASFELRFSYGSGGTSCKVYVQTSLDQGTTWVDVICGAFDTSSDTLIFNLSGLTPKTTGIVPTDGSLTDNTSLDGILGDRFRAKVTSVGTYATNTLLDVRMVAR